MTKYDYDLIVLGGGSAGLSLASVSARLGVKVALIDKGTLGGDCLHYGCVPSKTLIHAAKVAHLAQTSKDVGIRADSVSVDFPRVMERVREVIAVIQEHADNPDRFRKMGCDVWTEAEASFVDSHTVSIGEKKISGKKIAICVGSRPRTLPLSGLEGVGYLTNETIFSLSEQPKRLMIIGSGPIGCELAQAFQRLGTQVILLNRSERILGKEDSDVQELMKDIFEQEGIEMHLGIEMKQVRQENYQKILTLSANGNEEDIAADEILVAVGRQSNADTLQVENAGIELNDKGYIVTDAKLRTNVKHIYAAGDVTGHLQFTHSAGYEAGVILSNAILHLPKKVDLDSIPWTTFTDPEVASTGINETEAKKRNIPHTVSVFPFTHQDRALAEGTNKGFIKLVLGKKDKILGCQIVGPHAGELIHEWIVARAAKLSLSSIARLVHVYPTLAGGSQQAAGEHLGKKFFTKRTRTWLRRIFGYRNTALDT